MLESIEGLLTSVSGCTDSAAGITELNGLMIKIKDLTAADLQPFLQPVLHLAEKKAVPPLTTPAIFCLYKSQGASEVADRLVDPNTIVHVIDCLSTGGTPFVQAQALHLLLTHAVARCIELDREGSVDAYEELAGRIVGYIRGYAAIPACNEAVIVCINALLRLQLLTLNYADCARSLHSFRPAPDVSHTQLARFRFYASLALALSGQVSRALQQLAKAHQLVKEHFPTSSFNYEISAFMSLFRALAGVSYTIDPPKTTLTFEPIYDLLSNNPHLSARCVAVRLSHAYRHISLQDVCEKVGLGVEATQELLANCTREGAFQCQLIKIDGVPAVEFHADDATQKRAMFRGDALRLAARATEIREAFVKKSVVYDNKAVDNRPVDMAREDDESYDDDDYY
ncbi:hypothetical protein GMRT_14540 [Giardia muris]|uniref:COP9 signalosome complex subunit 3 n=1 Tax=Giardia muris TaxID=5742 RepID=A0A4Z1ST12_GIAMU|nr:hypothetical protein GMRT_14540 [Giardia muris]|eukprot:TNJ29066.1 hypothetical protein GMRT_14540 [Giardia muris]